MDAGLQIFSLSFEPFYSILFTNIRKKIPLPEKVNFNLAACKMAHWKPFACKQVIRCSTI